MSGKQEASGATLKRQLTPMHVWAIAFGCVIGWGSFINPGKKFLTNSGVAGTAIAMILGALVMVIIAFSFAYMVPKYPRAGGEFTFTKNCFSKTMAFICGWFLVVAYLTTVPMNSTLLERLADTRKLRFDMVIKTPAGHVKVKKDDYLKVAAFVKLHPSVNVDIPVTHDGLL